ncbi:MAG: MutS-related protein [Chitinophagaceae bacterium]
MEPAAQSEIVYRQEQQRLQALLAEQKKKQSRLGWLRLAIIIVTAVAAFQAFAISAAAGVIAILAGIAVFLVVVSIDVNNNNAISNTQKLLTINEDELKVLQHQFHHLYDGAHFAPDVHNYSNDLDIFGKTSLYQYINRCQSQQGRALLAQNFLEPLPANSIEERQKAVAELAPLYQWRQQMQALGMQHAITERTERQAQLWLQQEEEHFSEKKWQWIVPLYSLFAIASAVAAALGYIPTALFSFLFIIFLVVSSSLSKRASQAYAHLAGIVKEVDTLQGLMAWIEAQKFGSTLLVQLQQSVKVEGKEASVQIKNLKSILGRFDLRLNVLVFIFLNSFLLWDVRQMMALNSWRAKNKDKVLLWFRLVAEVEVLCSLATLKFNQPQWSFPSFTDHHFTFNATDLGHPLIPAESRVTSSFDVEGIAKVALVTGSNMAGKSTFLRSLGVSVVMAQMGAPVCAKSLELSPVQLMSSMRIADNLAENTSTFYAELKKLKTIIEAVRSHAPLFVLLDEILRGTNSLDRHIGSKALIKQLIKENAVAVIATHDVEIAKLEENYPQSIENYHFDVQVEGEELYFDYKLKHGVCTSLNASILMKKIGIEL